eukprot:gene7160-7967_t
MALNTVLILIAAVLGFLSHIEGNFHHEHHHHHQQPYAEDLADKRGGVPSLPALNVLVNSKETGVEFKIGECKMKLTISDKCKLTLQPTTDTCNGKIPLGSILDHFLPKNNISEKSNTFILPDKFDLKLVEVDKCKSTLTLKTEAREKLDLIPDKLSLEGVALDLMINYKTGAVDWELLNLDIAGTLTIAGQNITVSLKKKVQETDIKFSFKIDKLTIPDFLKIFSKKPVAPPKSDTAVVEKVTALSIKNPTVSGVYDPKGFYEVVLSGEPQGDTYKGGNFFAVVQKPEDDDVKLALLVKINLFSPAKLLTSLTGKDLMKIPLLKDITLNFALEISNKDFVAIKNEELAKAVSQFASGDKTISKGTKLKMDIPVKEVFKQMAPDLKTDDLPATLFLKVIIDANGLQFKFPDTWKTDLLKMLKAFAPKLKEFLPKWLNSDGPPMVTVKDFSFDYKTMAFTIDVFAPGPLKLGSILSLYNVSLMVTHKDENSPWEFSFSSIQTLFEEVTLKTKLSKKGENKYEFEGSISMISTGQLMKALGTKFISEETLKKIEFLNFGVKDVKIKAKFGDTFYLNVAGTAILFDWDGIEVDGITYIDKGTSVMALGIVINKIRLDEIVDKLFKKKLAGITWLAELKVAIVMSSTDAAPDKKDLKFSNPGLKDVPIKKGVLFRGEFKIPKDCKGDQICEISKNVTKNEKTERAFVIEGEVTPAGFQLRASYNGNWKIGENAVIPAVSLVIKVGSETKIYFEIKLNVINPKLEFQGTIGIGGAGSLELSAKMIGIYENAFGIKYLSFGNLAISIGIMPGNPMPALNLEGELRLGVSKSLPPPAPGSQLSRKGQVEAGNQIVAQAAMGIDPIKPQDTYFYAKINKFTLDAISKAFDLNIKLPKVLMESGFPEAVMVSFTASPGGKELNVLKTKIENGFRLQGKIRILGYDLYLDCAIAYAPKPKFKLQVELSPIKIAGGLIALQRSKNEPEKGPMFLGQISAAGVKIKIKAFVTVLGISVGANIDISDDGYEFSISGNLFDLVRADVTITSTYADIKTASFEVNACIATGPEIVKNDVKEALETAGKAATETMKEADKSALGIEDLYLKSKEGVTKMDEEVKDFQDKLRKKGKKISEAKRLLNEKCIEQCSTECIGGPDWDPKCLQVGEKFVGCTVWNDCKFKVPNYECLAECKGKKLIGKLKAKAKQAALDVLLFLLKGVKKLFNLGKSFFDSSKKLLSTAKEVLSDVADQMKAGIDAAKAIASTALESIVQIHSMCFESALTEASKGCVGLSINATFFKTRRVEFDTRGCLHLSFAKTIAEAISNKLYPGISAIKGQISKVKAKLGLIEQEKRKVEATADEAKELDKSDDDSSSKRDVVWSEEENYYRRLAYEQLPRYTLLDEATLRAFTKDTASQKATKDDAMAKAIISNPSNSASNASVLKKRESVNKLDSSDHCVKLSSVVKGYKDITFGLSGLVNTSEQQKQKFNEFLTRKRNKINRLTFGLRSECFYYGCRKDELNDALFYARKAKDGSAKNNYDILRNNAEISSWGKIVRSQIDKQDKDAMKFWKRQLDANYIETTGLPFTKYLDELGRSGADASKRMQMPTSVDSDRNAQMLQSFSKDIKRVMNDEQSISGAAPKIKDLFSKLADISSLATSCRQTMVKKCKLTSFLSNLLPHECPHHTYIRFLVSQPYAEDFADKRGGFPSLPALNVLVNSKETGVEFKIGECKVKLTTSDECKLTLQPSNDTCNGTIPLGSILDHFLPKNNISEKSNTFILPDKFDLKLVEVDKCNSTLMLKTEAREKLDLIPDKLSLEGVALDLMINYKTGAVDWELLKLDIAGTLTIAGQNITVSLKKKVQETDIKFSFKIDELAIPVFLTIFSKKPVAPPKSDTAVVDKVIGLSIKNLTVSGVYDPKGFYEVVLSGEPQGASYQGGSFFAVVQKPEDDHVKLALLVKINLFSPAKLLSNLTGKPLMKVPLLKDITLNFALEISNKDFVAIKNEELAEAVGQYASGDKTISKGTKLKMDIPVKEVFKQMAPDLKADYLPATLFLKVIIDENGLQFKFPDTWKTDLLKMLKAFAPKLKEFLPKWLNCDGPPMVTVKDFSFDYKTMAFTIDVFAPGPLKLGGILSLYNVSLKVTRKDENSPWEFSFSSIQTLFEEVTLKTKLSKEGENKYEFEGSISMISTGQLMKALGTKFISEETLKKIEFLNFGVKDVKIKAKFGDTFYLNVAGTAILFDWDGIEVDGITYIDKGTSVMAFGIVINKIRLDEIVDKVFKKKLAGITWLAELKVAIVMSSTDASPDKKDLKFSNPGLKDVPIKKGVLFRGEFKIPKDCKGDQICEISKNVTRNETRGRVFVIEGEVTPARLQLRASYNGNWRIGENAVIPAVSLVIKVGSETKVYFQIKLNVINPKLEFQGTIGIGGAGSLELSAKMIGIYENAFGIKYLSFGNLAISIGIMPGNPMPALNLEGELRLGVSKSSPPPAPGSQLSRKGQVEAGNQILAQAAMGIDPIKPQDTYFYAKINKFTLDAISKAFDLNIKLPKVLMESGFPEAVMVSFTASPRGKELSVLKTKIENGFRLQGKIRILGSNLYLDCAIAYAPKPKLKLQVEMLPINIAGGLIALQRSKNEPEKGPMFLGQISAAGVKIKIKAFVTVLGISVGANIDISDDGYEFSISGNLFDLVRADVTITSTYADIKTASFEVNACIATGPEIVKNDVKEALETAGKAATETMKEADKSALAIGDLYLKSKKGVTKMDQEVKDFQDKLRKKGKKISEAKRLLNEKCIEQCSTECIGGPDWDPKCLQVGERFVGCTVWNDCKFKVPNYECLAECKGKKLIGKLKAKAKQAALDALLFLLKGVKKLFNLGKSFFDNSKKLLSTAKEVLSDVADQMKAGIDAAKAMASTAIESIVQIHSMCFESALTEASKGCVGLSINATFFKTRRVEFDTRGCLHLSFAKTIAEAISDKLYPGISAIKGKISKVKAKLGLIEQEKVRVEANADEAEDIDKSDDDSSSKRDVVWSEEENYYRKLAYEQLPRYTLLDEATLRAFTKDTASQKATKDDAMAKAIISNPSNSASNASVLKERESVNKLDSSDHCVKLSSVVKGYKDITFGLSGLVNASEQQKQKFSEFLTRKRNKINRLKLGLRSECFYYGCRKDELNDALFYARKAKDEISCWGKIVRSQIDKQDKDAMKFWKRQLDANYIETTGLPFTKYLDELVTSGADASKRMQMPTSVDSDRNAQMLQSFSKDIKRVINDEQSISGAAPKIKDLFSKLADISSLATSCRQTMVKK